MPLRCCSERFFFLFVCFFSLISCDIFDDELIDGVRNSVSEKDAEISDSGGTNDSITEIDIPTDSETNQGSATFDELCGDGRVTGTEVCDIAIQPGSPGACPCDPDIDSNLYGSCSKDNLSGQCPASKGCIQWQIVGELCWAHCEKKAILSCQSGDDCCPIQCTNANDLDCSTSCGNGVVEPDKGEFCEPVLAETNISNSYQFACPTKCEDDDPCTEEIFIGSADKCNALCLHVKTGTTSLTKTDGCCPDGANANTDVDCTAVCGNGIREADEQCDGGQGCDEGCVSLEMENQRKCIDDFDIFKGECEKCLCTNCTNETLLCLDSDNAEFDAQCTNILECGERTECLGAYCYCGSETTLTNSCFLGTAADGPCKTEIEEAAVFTDGLSDGATVFLQATDRSTPIGRAFSFGTCKRRNCLDVCPAVSMDILNYFVRALRSER